MKLKTKPHIENILNSLCENISDLIVVTDIEGMRLSCSQSYSKLLGGSKSILGTLFFNEIHPDDKERVVAFFEKNIKKQDGEQIQYRLILPDKTSYFLESKIITIPDAKNKPAHILIISKDITERTQSEKQIRLLAHAVSCTKDAFLLTDMQENLLFVNPAMCNMYGYTEEELLGKKITILRSPVNSAKLLEQIYPATLSGGWNGILRQRKKDGTDFPVELWTSVVDDDEGKPIAMVCVARDISKRHRAEEQLRDIAERLQLTLDNLDILAFELDSEGKFLLSRGKGLEKLGLKPDEVVGLSAFELYKDNPDVIRILKNVYHEGIAGETDINVRGYVWNANFLPLKDEHGKIERVFGTAIDITGRKRIEEKLTRESELLHTLMDTIPDTIYFKDIASRFTRINESQAKVLGVKKVEDALGKTDADFFSPDHAARALSDEQNIIKTALPILGKAEKVPLSDGKVHWFSTTKVPFRDQKGNIIGIVGSSRDISELKQAEELESALYRITEETSVAGNLQKLFAVIHKIISGLMYAKNFYISLYDSEKDLLSFPYFIDEVDIPPEPVNAGKGLTAYVLRTGKSLLCDQAVSDDLERRGEAVLVGAPAPIWLGVPLIVEGKTIGAMVVQHYSDASVYGEREKHILEFVSTQVAKAIERKRAEEALKQSEDRYRAFVEQSTEGIWRFDSDFPISTFLPEEEQIKLFFKHFYLAECNDAMAQMYGYLKASEIIGTKLEDMLIPNEPRNYEIFANFVRSGYRLTQVESRELDRFGNMKIFLNNFVGIIENNSIKGWWGTQIDVTERKHAEEKLRHSEEKFRMLFEESQDCIIFSSVDGKLLDVNPAGVELFGYSSKEEMFDVGNVIELYSNPDDRETFTSHLTQHRFLRDLEVAIKRKNGEKKVVLESASTVSDLDGSIIGYRSFFRDITERKKLEEQLRQAQKMESIGTLAGGIAHDFNNILGIILGYSSLLESGISDPQRAAQSIDTIKKAVQRGADLVRQLLTFARKGEPSFSAIDVNGLVLELTKMLKQTFPKNINIDDLLHDNLPSIIADSNQLHIALLNLCVNARDAITADGKIGDAGGGRITLGTGLMKRAEIRQKFPDASASEYIFISIKDTGVGMDEETRNRMFEPFFTTKELGKGTGLGLSVVYGVVNSHNGFVDVDSTLGVGSTFTLYFPAVKRETEDESQEEDKITLTPKGSETILIVEDEEMLANLLAAMFEDQGYEVLIAKDGQEGIEIFTSNTDKINLVLSDMGLPRLGGFEMFMKMKEVKPNVIAILASGYFDPNLKKELIDAGAKDFIQKPYMPEVILQRIREILDERRK
ncbi:MAG: PAS domain S-box protein [Bacteroidota bacterium]|nr:PAS domain S-box protein [Bacteroidota bacterium]